MSFTSALSQASFHNNWTIAWQKKVLHLLTFSGTLQLFIKSAWQKMCYLLPHFSRLPVLLNKVYRTLFSLYAKNAWQKKSAWEPSSPVPAYSTPLAQFALCSALHCPPVQNYITLFNKKLHCTAVRPSQAPSKAQLPKILTKASAATNAR